MENVEETAENRSNLTSLFTKFKLELRTDEPAFKEFTLKRFNPFCISPTGLGQHDTGAF